MLASAAEQNEYKRKLAQWEEKTKEIRAHRSRSSRSLSQGASSRRTSTNTRPRSGCNHDVRRKTRHHAVADVPQGHWLLGSGMDEDGNGVGQKLKGEPKKQWEELRKQLAVFDDIKPKPLPIGSGITDVGPQATTTYMLNGGAYGAHKEEVQPGFLSSLTKTLRMLSRQLIGRTTGRRMALANWLADPDNPLTARVMVNRIWHYHFGRGIVGTPSDFGFQREKETNLPLLDYLAATFVERGWSIKSIHRLIMLLEYVPTVIGVQSGGAPE